MNVLAIGAVGLGAAYLYMTGALSGGGTKKSQTNTPRASLPTTPTAQVTGNPNPTAPVALTPGQSTLISPMENNTPTQVGSLGYTGGPQPDPSVNYSQLKNNPIINNRGLVQRDSPYGTTSWVVPDGTPLNWNYATFTTDFGPNTWINGGIYSPSNQHFGYGNDAIVSKQGNKVSTANGDFPPLSPDGMIAFTDNGGVEYQYMRLQT